MRWSLIVCIILLAMRSLKRWLLLVCLILLVGCGPRMVSDEQAQALSEADQGMQALTHVVGTIEADQDTGALALTPEQYQRIVDLVTGAAGYLAGALANLDVPTAEHQALALALNAEAAADYAKDGAATRANPPAGKSWRSWLMTGLTVITTLITTATGVSLLAKRSGLPVNGAIDLVRALLSKQPITPADPMPTLGPAQVRR